jgi:hypothetical protein
MADKLKAKKNVKFETHEEWENAKEVEIQVWGRKSVIRCVIYIHWMKKKGKGKWRSEIVQGFTITESDVDCPEPFVAPAEQVLWQPTRQHIPTQLRLNVLLIYIYIYMYIYIYIRVCT